MQPSASKVGLLLQCAWPFNNPAVPPAIPTAAMQYGNAVHAVLETAVKAGVPPRASMASVPNVAKRFDVDEKELRQKAEDAYAELIAWLRGKNAWSLKLLPAPKGAILTEKPVAINLLTGAARFCAPVDDRHVYPDVSPDEHPGTADIAIRLAAYGKSIPVKLRKTIIILDHKTGFTVDMPRESAQLKSLALGFTRVWRAQRAIVALLHAPRERDAIPVVFADMLTAEDIAEHFGRLQAQWPRIGDGSLKPHPGCGWCPGISVCPAHGASLAMLADTFAPPGTALEDEARKKIRESNGLVTARPKVDLATAEGRGVAHMLVQVIRRVDDELSGRLKELLREEGFDERGNSVRFGVRPDGKVLLLHQSEREHLSMASIKRHLSAAEAQKIEKLLRAKGCVELHAREELRAVDDR